MKCSEEYPLFWDNIVLAFSPQYYAQELVVPAVTVSNTQAASQNSAQLPGVDAAPRPLPSNQAFTTFLASTGSQVCFSAMFLLIPPFSASPGPDPYPPSHSLCNVSSS